MFIICYLSGLVSELVGSAAAAVAGLLLLILLGLLLIMNAVAVTLMTKVGGVAYTALNLYYGAWLMFVASFLAFNDWLLYYASFSAQQVREARPLTSLTHSLISSIILINGRELIKNKGMGISFLFFIRD